MNLGYQEQDLGEELKSAFFMQCSQSNVKKITFGLNNTSYW